MQQPPTTHTELPTVEPRAVAPMRIVIATVATQREPGQSVRANRHEIGIAERSIIDLTDALMLSDEEQVRTDHRCGYNVDVMQTVMSDT